MPTYEYECKTCGSTFDHFQPITSEPLKRFRCEKCGKVRPVRRLLGTGGALIFKGSGFYTTDYRGDSYKKAAEAEAGASKPAKEGDSSKSTAKSEPAQTAPKTESKSKKKDGGAK